MELDSHGGEGATNIHPQGADPTSATNASLSELMEDFQ